MAAFADMLIYFRKRDGLSQQALADSIGLTRSAIGMYETGKREPDFETLEVFADFFNVNMDVLLGKSSEESRKTPDTFIDVEGLSTNKRALFDFVMSLSDEEAEELLSFARIYHSKKR